MPNLRPEVFHLSRNPVRRRCARPYFCRSLSHRLRVRFQPASYSVAACNVRAATEYLPHEGPYRGHIGEAVLSGFRWGSGDLLMLIWTDEEERPNCSTTVSVDRCNR